MLDESLIKSLKIQFVWEDLRIKERSLVNESAKKKFVNDGGRRKENN
jgi:hypothetical protein